MIIVLQSIPDFLSELSERARNNIAPEHFDQIVFTSNFRKVLDRVVAAKTNSDRTIVISSSVFYGDPVTDPAANTLTSSILATSIKSIDPNAWFFVYSTMPDRNEHVDGAIPKDSPNMWAHALAFLAIDFTQINTLEDLRRRLPWLQ